jgi:hypothetical protein
MATGTRPHTAFDTLLGARAWQRVSSPRKHCHKIVLVTKKEQEGEPRM